MEVIRLEYDRNRTGLISGVRGMFLNNKEDADSGEQVLLLYAKSQASADEYVQLLADHDIIATVGDDQWEGDTESDEDENGYEGIPVLVPESCIDEAELIIADSEDALGYDFDDEGELDIHADDEEILAPSPDMMLMDDEDMSDDMVDMEDDEP